MNELSHLLSLVGKQDQVAFQKLYEQTSPRLYALCLRLSWNNREQAEDLLQDSFTRIWQRATKFSPDKGNAMTWMNTIIRNQAIDRFRFNSRRPQLVAEPEFETPNYIDKNHQPDEQQLLNEGLKRLDHVLQGLPDRHRECVLQSFYYGYSHSEIAKRMSLPLGTVKAWIRRSLKKMRDASDDEDNFNKNLTLC